MEIPNPNLQTTEQPANDLTLKEYEDFAIGLVSPITEQTRQTIVEYQVIVRGILTMIRFLGEDIDQIKKLIYYQKPITQSLLTILKRRYLAIALVDVMEKRDDKLSLSDAQINLLHAVFGIVGEAGELVEPILNAEKLSDPYAKGGVIEESGDALWYLPLAANSVGSSLQEIAAANMRKLKKRYASGSFSQGEAITRDTDSEIQALKGEKDHE